MTRYQQLISRLKLWNNSHTLHDKVVVGTTFTGSLIGGVLCPQFLNPKTTSEYALYGVMCGAGGGCILGATSPVVIPIGILGCAIGCGVYAYDGLKK